MGRTFVWAALMFFGLVLASSPAPAEDARVDVEPVDHTDEIAYGQALKKAWQELFKSAGTGTLEQRLERYKAFLGRFPKANPYKEKVLRTIVTLEAQLEMQKSGKLKAQEKKADLDTKRKWVKELELAYDVAKFPRQQASEQVKAWDVFLQNYPVHNPYLKIARKKRRQALARAKKQGGKMARGKGSIIWRVSHLAQVQFTRSEITMGQYRACVREGVCTSPRGTSPKHPYCNWGRPRRHAHPINCVDYAQAKTFCHWAGGRLPSRKEWTAEASKDYSFAYPWGTQSPSCKRAVMNRGGDGCGMDRTWPVCSKILGMSTSGLCDMAGNLAEWTTTLAPRSSTKHPASSTANIVCGGAWNSKDALLLSAVGASNELPTTWSFTLGFRCVRPVDK